MKNKNVYDKSYDIRTKNQLFRGSKFNFKDSKEKAKIIDDLCQDKNNIPLVFELLLKELKMSSINFFSELIKINSFALKLRSKEQKDLLVISYDEKNKSMFNFLLDNNWNINTRFMKNTTLLHYSIFKEDYNLFDKLLKRGADLNIENDFDKGETPLILSVKNKISEEGFHYKNYFAEKLIQYGADVNLKNKFNIPPVYYALLFKNLRILDILLDNSAILDEPTGKKKGGKSPLDYVQTLKQKSFSDLDRKLVSLVEYKYIQGNYSPSNKKKMNKPVL